MMKRERVACLSSFYVFTPWYVYQQTFNIITRLYYSTLTIPGYVVKLYFLSIQLFLTFLFKLMLGYTGNENRHEKRAIRSINQFNNFLATKVDISRK